MGALIFVSIYILSSLWPKYEERFIAMGILGKNMKAEDYYSGNDSRIKVGDKIQWYIYLYNHWDKTQNISILIKVLNSTMPAPDDLRDEPSPIPPIWEIRLILDENETKIVPFFWYIKDVEIQENMTIIKELVINDNPVSLNIYGENTTRFRLIFELWILNEETGKYEYGWDSKGVHYCVWNGMWFQTAP